MHAQPWAAGAGPTHAHQLRQPINHLKGPDFASATICTLPHQHESRHRKELQRSRSIVGARGLSPNLRAGAQPLCNARLLVATSLEASRTLCPSSPATSGPMPTEASLSEPSRLQPADVHNLRMLWNAMVAMTTRRAPLVLMVAAAIAFRRKPGRLDRHLPTIAERRSAQSTRVDARATKAVRLYAAVAAPERRASGIGTPSGVPSRAGCGARCGGG